MTNSVSVQYKVCLPTAGNVITGRSFTDQIYFPGVVCACKKRDQRRQKMVITRPKCACDLSVWFACDLSTNGWNTLDMGFSQIALRIIIDKDIKIHLFLSNFSLILQILSRKIWNSSRGKILKYNHFPKILSQELWNTDIFQGYIPRSDNDVIVCWNSNRENGN